MARKARREIFTILMIFMTMTSSICGAHTYTCLSYHSSAPSTCIRQCTGTRMREIVQRGYAPHFQLWAGSMNKLSCQKVIRPKPDQPDRQRRPWRGARDWFAPTPPSEIGFPHCLICVGLLPLDLYLPPLIFAAMCLPPLEGNPEINPAKSYQYPQWTKNVQCIYME